MVARYDMSAHSTEGELTPAESWVHGRGRVRIFGTEEDQAARLRPGFVASPRQDVGAEGPIQVTQVVGVEVRGDPCHRVEPREAGRRRHVPGQPETTGEVGREG